ncbi:hypothetical protein Tco_0863127 [Tanacetum coccineum]
MKGVEVWRRVRLPRGDKEVFVYLVSKCGDGGAWEVKMDDPNITMEECIRLEEEKARRHVFNDALTSEVALSCEPTVSPLNDNQIDFRISFDESDNEDYTLHDFDNGLCIRIGTDWDALFLLLIRG